MRRMTAPAPRLDYTGIDELLYTIDGAASLLAMHPATLTRLSKNHKVYLPRRRQNGLCGKVYTNHQVAAIKQVQIGNMTPDEGYKAAYNADREEADLLAGKL